MQTQTNANKPLHPLIWVAGVALILFSVVGIGAFMGWIPASKATPGDTALPEPQAASTVAPVEKTHAAPVHHRIAARDDGSPTPRSSRVMARCDQCGIVETVRTIDTKGEGSGLGAVGGGVVGGLLGNQVGDGRGKDAMTVVGAIGGAMAGNEVEKRSKSTRSYATTIRFDDGSSRTINEANAPMWRSGDKVKVVNGVIEFNN